MQPQTELIRESSEEIFARVFAQYRPRTPLSGVDLTFKPYANANSAIAWRDSRLAVKMSDLWQGAPPPVIYALAHILIAKMFRREAPPQANATYRRWLNRQDVRRDMERVKQARGRKFVSGPEGKTWNLEEIFEELNLKYFGGMMARPDLGWSRRPSHTTLGHYDSAHHAIILSSLMDDARVGRLAVEYVLYHEMLHLKHPVDHHGARRCVHTRAFREDEKAFDGLAEAKAALQRMCDAARSRRRWS